MWHDIIVALCLLLVAEGIMPFLSPLTWRRMAFKIAQLNDHSLRMIGLASMLVGVAGLYLING